VGGLAAAGRDHVGARLRVAAAEVLEPERARGAAARSIVTQVPGYAMVLEPGQLDLDRFERLVAEGRRALAEGRPAEAAERLRAALGLWRGRALADLENEPFAQVSLAHLEELRLSALEDRVAADLAFGRQAELVPELQELTQRHPLRERLREQLMLALYRCGRQADALAAYHALRQTLLGELGIEPSQSLKRLQQSILNQAPELDAPRPPPGGGPSQAPERLRKRRGRWRIAALAGAAALAVAGIATGLLASRSGPERVVAVPPNSVARIDMRSNRVVAAVPVGLTPTSISAGDDAVWVLNADDQTLSRIDPRTDRVQTFGSGGVPTDVAAGRGAVWVGNGERGHAQFVGPVATTISRIDSDTHAVYATSALPRARSATSNLNQNHIAVGGGGVWVVAPDGSVSRVDPRTVAITATVPSVSAAAITADARQVWVLETDLHLTRIDPRTHAVVARVPIAATSLSALAVGGGAVWATDPSDGTLWRVDSRPRLVERTIPVGVGASAVAYGGGSVWVANTLRGTVSRVDPRSNRVIGTIPLAGSPRQLSAGSGSVWVTVAGPPTGSVPSAAVRPIESALPSATCGKVFYGGPGRPDRLIVSDLPLRGGPRLATGQMSAAIESVLRRRGFRAGRFRIAYQPCDDSTSQTGIFDEHKCAANAELYARSGAVIGEIGPYNSGCAYQQIPILNRTASGPLAMVSPTNSDVPLTRSSPLVPAGNLARLYPSGRRNYVRIFPADDMQAAANALFARDMGARRVLVLTDGGYGEAEALYFPRAARRLGLHIVGVRRWDPTAAGYEALAAAVARSRPDLVFVSGLLDANGGRVVRAIRARLPRVPLLGTDGFLPISGLFATAGRLPAACTSVQPA
jgi:DNA-binding beta-propeller fold protein YncE